VLGARGLPDALRGPAVAAGLAATVEAAGVGRYPAEVEAAVYFFCRATLRAVAEHAPADTRVAIKIAEDEDALRLVVDCEVVGGLDGAADLLSSARDRIEALGGVLWYESAAGVTRLEATVPLA